MMFEDYAAFEYHWHNNSHIEETVRIERQPLSKDRITYINGSDEYIASIDSSTSRRYLSDIKDSSALESAKGQVTITTEGPWIALRENGRKQMGSFPYHRCLGPVMPESFEEILEKLKHEALYQSSL